ncbi:hypothetical protein ACFWGD_11160 [Corynebacterium sp. NPDC060344]|uniref:hypothetical protein n=1 Tax=Corynebacterium sp. NPDC060344 TaxID=3347101 RepID=UPI0036559662
MILTLVLVAVLVVSFWGQISTLFNDPVETVTESTTTEVVNAVEREEQVVLVSSSVQGLHKTETRRTAFGQNVPGSGRTHFLQYTYTAKLGIEGKDVDIRETADNEFTIVIPAFTFIGHSDPTFETVLEDGGALRFVAPEIDTADVITQVLNGEAKAEHVRRNTALLKDQAKVFYSGIVHSIDEDAKLTFEYRNPASG